MHETIFRDHTEEGGIVIFSSLYPHQNHSEYIGEMYKIQSQMLSAYFEAPLRELTVTHRAFELSFPAREGQMVSVHPTELSFSFTV